LAPPERYDILENTDRSLVRDGTCLSPANAERTCLSSAGKEQAGRGSLAFFWLMRG
jgi:hypothetical protein